MDGNKKNIKLERVLNIFFICNGEFAIIDEPVVAVVPSKMPALAAATNIDTTKNSMAYM